MILIRNGLLKQRHLFVCLEFIYYREPKLVVSATCASSSVESVIHGKCNKVWCYIAQSTWIQRIY